MNKIKKWKVLEETDVSPSHWFPIVKHKIELPNGKIVDDYYMAKLGDVSMIMAITKSNQIIFVKQYKHGYGDEILELPAGFINKGETPEQSVARELSEETGFSAINIESLGKLAHSPTKSTQTIFPFFAKDVAQTGTQNFDENEDVEVVLIPLNKIDEKIRNHEIVVSDTLATITLAKVHFPGLFK